MSTNQNHIPIYSIHDCTKTFQNINFLKIISLIKLKPMKIEFRVAKIKFGFLMLLNGGAGDLSKAFYPVTKY